MTPRITIEDRLENKAYKGITCGFTLKLWPSQAKALERKGLVLRNPKPTKRRGEKEYEIDFSIPVPGTYSEDLYKIAVEHQPQPDPNAPLAEPLHPPYAFD